jgi:hypothetical protein
VAFVKNNQADAQRIADDLQIPIEWVLTVSAQESAWGRSPVAQNANNYFGIGKGGWAQLERTALDRMIIPFLMGTDFSILASRLRLSQNGTAPLV